MTDATPTKKTLILKDGLTVGGVVHKDVEFKDIRARDILEATESSERVVCTKDGKAVSIVSDARLGLEILRRRIAKFGTLEMPVTLDELLNLTEDDITAMQDAVEELDEARRVATLGRH